MAPHEPTGARPNGLGEVIRRADISRLEGGDVTFSGRRPLATIPAALELPPGELLVRTGWVGGDAAFDTQDFTIQADGVALPLTPAPTEPRGTPGQPDAPSPPISASP